MRRLITTLLLLTAVACSGPTPSPDGSTSALTADPAFLDLGASSSGSFDIDTTEAWSATASVSWLEVSPAAGAGPARVEVTAHREGLVPDTRHAEVVIASGGHQTVVLVGSRFPTIDVHATQGGSLAVHPTSLAAEEERPVDSDDHHPNELVVTLHPSAADGAPSTAGRVLAALARDHGATVVRSISTGTRTVATLRITEDLSRAARRLRDDPRVRSVSPSVPVEVLESDPLSSQQAWHYGQIDMEQAWVTTMGSGAVTVAVIDTGFDRLHEDLAANLQSGYDFGDMDADAHAATSACGDHGTHVAGTVGAPLNGLGGTGVAPAVMIAPLKVGSYNTSTGVCEIWAPALLDAIYHAAGATVSGAPTRDEPVDVINISLGLAHYYTPLHDAVRFAASQGVTIVAASGNDGERGVMFPAAHAEVIAVGATNAKAERARYSIYGPELDLMAPGGDGRFAWVTSTLWSETHDAYGGMQGTSMATPHVVGVVALMKSVNRGLGPSTVQHLLRSTATDIGDPGWDELTGYGIVDAEAAVHAAQAHGSSDDPEDLTFRLYSLNEDGSRALLAETTSASTLQYHQADFGTYLAEVGNDTDRNGVLGEPGEWYGSEVFDATPDQGDQSVTVTLRLQ